MEVIALTMMTEGTMKSFDHTNFPDERVSLWNIAFWLHDKCLIMQLLCSADSLFSYMISLLIEVPVLTCAVCIGYRSYPSLVQVGTVRRDRGGHPVTAGRPRSA